MASLKNQSEATLSSQKAKGRPAKRNEERANDEAIVVKGAREHNLKGINAVFPREKLVVITGPSGSGKSSLAFDTVYSEGQRRYVESLSAYARQFLEQYSKPNVDSITGLGPTISIEQRTTSYNPRSTVGTTTEISDYLRVLFARIGKPFCYSCGKAIHSQSPQQIVDSLLSLPKGTRCALLAPIVRGRKGEYQKELQLLRKQGFVRVRIDGEIHDLSEEIQLDKNFKHSIDVYVDRFVLNEDPKSMAARMSESVELGLKLGKGQIILENQEGDRRSETLLSEKFACVDCGISYPEPEPRMFSFNSPMGACSSCEGLGVDIKLKEKQESEENEIEDELLVHLELTPENTPCKSCQGSRLKKESLSFKIGGQSIAQVSELPIDDAVLFFKDLQLSDREQKIAKRILQQIQERLQFLSHVGVNYLSLSRSAQTLSGGEAQRIRLATQIGSALVGVIYVLDEPSIGLHQRDNDKLLETLMRLRDLGNSVLVVEHDRETIEKADWVLDLGPGAGTQGGYLCASGSVSDILRSPKSLTGKYLKGELKIETPKQRRKPEPGRVLRIEGACQNNLKNVTVDFPLGLFTCVIGVSGSGKSTLVIDTLYRQLVKKLYRVNYGDLGVQNIEGLDLVDKVVDIDQSPIGKTPRSNPATYTGIFSLIRDLFASLPESQVRGYKPGRFSFNVKGGRCETCEGGGMQLVEMHFLPNVTVECPTCHGKRYNRETLDIRYKGLNIYEVLEMTGKDALTFFDAVPKIKTKLSILNAVGLGYLTLGQAATTLSGGEAQRIKLSKELSKRGTGKTVYILDEPTTGLHFDDVKKLLNILQTLTDQGNTVIVIEHNLDLIKAADHIIEMGPDGGKNGGQLIASGTPEEICKIKESPTGPYLKRYL